MSYFLIYNSDGDTTVKKMSKEQVEEMINEEETEFYDECPETGDTNSWPGEGTCLLIKGKVVAPRNVEIVIKKEID